MTPSPLILRKIFNRWGLGPDLIYKVFILKGWVRIMSRGFVSGWLCVSNWTRDPPLEIELLNVSELPDWLQRDLA